MSGRVLVLDAATRQSLVAIRALGRRGLRVTAGAYRTRSAGALSKYADAHFTYPTPWEDPAAFVDALAEEVVDAGYDALLVSRESTVGAVVSNRDRLAEHVGLPYPSYETLDVALDKGRTVEAAAAADVPHPTTLAPTELDRETVESTLGYPVVVKPRRSHGREGVAVCRSFEELTAAFERITREYGPALLQEFVPNGGELGAYVIYDFDSNRRAATVQERVRSYPPEGGASTLRRTVADDDLLSTADDLLSALDWQGVAMVEFREDARDGEPKLMEINPRLWGSLSLSIAASVDFPHLLYQLGSEGRCDAVPSYRTGVYARRLEGELAHVATRRDRLAAIREVLRPSPGPCRFDVLSLSDPLPMVGHVREVSPWPT